MSDFEKSIWSALITIACAVIIYLVMYFGGW